MPTLYDTFLRLRPDSSVDLLEAEGFWPKLMAGQLGNFHHEYLVTTASFTASWQSWERHLAHGRRACRIAAAVHHGR